MEDGAVADADRAARVWWSPAADAIRLGTGAHKVLFCRMLLDTFNPYKPAVIDWPTLDVQTRDRLVSLPIWDIAVQTEGKAKLRVMTYAETVADPLLREAIGLNGLRKGGTRRCSPTWYKPMVSRSPRAGLPPAARS